MAPASYRWCDEQGEPWKNGGPGSVQIIITDGAPTGLLDAKGAPIWRMPDPIGFLRGRE
jgi:hypothetical protein